VRFDVRVGAVYSGALAEGAVLLLEDAGTDNLQVVDVQPTVGPAADAAILLGFSEQVEGQLRLGVAQQNLSGSGPAGSWGSGGVTSVTMAAGLVAHVWPRVQLRGAMGKLLYSSRSQVFAGGSSTGLLLTGGMGYELPWELSFGLRLDGDVQWHSFGSTALRQSGAADGSVFEISLKIAALFGGER
jgi:hypothetical protein